MSKFKPGQKVVCVNTIGHINPECIKLVVGNTYTILQESEIFPGSYFIAEHTRTITGDRCSYMESHFEPLIEPRSEFVEVTYQQIKEANPKICAS